MLRKSDLDAYAEIVAMPRSCATSARPTVRAKEVSFMPRYTLETIIIILILLWLLGWLVVPLAGNLVHLLLVLILVVVLLRLLQGRSPLP
jgi:hypothetical protein